MMKLKKLIYSIAATSMIAPIAIESFNSISVQASSNNVTANDIKSKDYYGRKSIGFYGFKHANGLWKENRDLKKVVYMDSDRFSNYMANGGTIFKVKGNYVSFDQSLNEIVHKKSLVVKISTIAKYANDHGGKSMLKNIKTMGTPKELKARFPVNN